MLYVLLLIHHVLLSSLSLSLRLLVFNLLAPWCLHVLNWSASCCLDICSMSWASFALILACIFAVLIYTYMYVCIYTHTSMYVYICIHTQSHCFTSLHSCCCVALWCTTLPCTPLFHCLHLIVCGLSFATAIMYVFLCSCWFVECYMSWLLSCFAHLFCCVLEVLRLPELLCCTLPCWILDLVCWVSWLWCLSNLSLVLSELYCLESFSAALCFSLPVLHFHIVPESFCLAWILETFACVNRLPLCCLLAALLLELHGLGVYAPCCMCSSWDSYTIFLALCCHYYVHALALMNHMHTCMHIHVCMCVAPTLHLFWVCLLVA